MTKQTSTPQQLLEFRTKNIRFSDTLDTMKQMGIPVPDAGVQVGIAEAKAVLTYYFQQFLSIQNKQFVWLPEYEEIVSWLTDNKGKGLFLYGHCGRGKSFLARYVLPAIILNYKGLVVSCFDVQEMNKNIDSVINKRLISLDEIGTEEVSCQYGNKRMALPEIMDAVEKRGKLIIISTNLDQQEIIKHYGDRTFERITATTKRVLFSGDSLRER